MDISRKKFVMNYFLMKSGSIKKNNEILSNLFEGWIIRAFVGNQQVMRMGFLDAAACDPNESCLFLHCSNVLCAAVAHG